MTILAQIDKAEEVLAPFREANPYAYSIIIGLVALLGGAIWYIKTLHTKVDTLHTQKDELHESKLALSVSSTETVREAITLVKSIHENVSALNSGVVDRKLFEQEIRTKLDNIENDIHEFLAKLKDE